MEKAKLYSPCVILLCYYPKVDFLLYARLLFSESSIETYLPFLQVILEEDFVNYLYYMKNLAKKTSYNQAVKNYYASKVWSSTLKNSTGHFTVC